MTPQRLARIRSVLNKRQADLTVIADQVHKGRNLAAIVRTCDAAGIDQIYNVLPEDGYQTFRGTSAGAQKWVEVNHYDTIKQPFDQLKKKGYQIVAANLSNNAVNFRDIDYTKPTAIIMGAEIKGVSDYASENVDANIVVPMVGMVESFNVSVACALILNEAQRQRELVGMYDAPSLSQERYKQLFFRWAHPKIAQICDEKGLQYPKVDENGEVCRESLVL